VKEVAALKRFDCIVHPPRAVCALANPATALFRYQSNGTLNLLEWRANTTSSSLSRVFFVGLWSQCEGAISEDDPIFIDFHLTPATKPRANSSANLFDVGLRFASVCVLYCLRSATAT